MKLASLRRSSRRFLALFLAAVGIGGAFSAAGAKEITTGDVRITAAGAREGKAAVTPWSGTWWPMADGELALGWNGTGADFTYDAATKRWSRALTQKPVDDRAPMLKYDDVVRQATGTDPGCALLEVQGDARHSHHVYGDEKERYDREGISYSWWGHCNGWCAAAILAREPVGPVTHRGVRFDVADLKGLLTESHFGVESEFTGRRYNKPALAMTEARATGRTLLASLGTNAVRPVAEFIAWYEKAWETTMSAAAKAAARAEDFRDELTQFEDWFKRTYDDAYADLPPDVFHKILESVVGQRKLSFVCDITANEEVWNHPLYAYESTVTFSRDLTENGAARKEWTVRTVCHYATDGVSESVIGVEGFTKTYTYTLVTEADGRLVRGAWTGASVDEHPDFAWLPVRNPTTVDAGENSKLIYGKLLEILPAVNDPTQARPFDVQVNGVRASTKRANDQTTTWSQPVAAPNGDVSLVVVPAAGRTIARVAYFEQLVDGSTYPVARRAPLVSLGETTTPATPVTARLDGTGKHLLLAYGYDAAGRLLGVDEVTVQGGGNTPQPTTDDTFEQNDTQAAAAVVAAGNYANLRCNDDDWFKVTLAAPGTLTVKITFKNSEGDLDLSVEGVGTSEGTGDTETVTKTALAAGTYAIRVHGYNGAKAAYALDVAVSGGAPVATDDPYEQNDTRAAAAALAPGVYTALRCEDDDFFKVTVPGGATLEAKTAFRHATGDLELELLDAAGARLASSTSATDAESVKKTNLGPGTYLVRVYGYNGAKGAYDLTVTVTAGTPTPPTTTGTITANTLNVRRGPATTFAIVTTRRLNDVVTILEERNGWVRITWSGAPAGELWVSKTYVRV